MQLGSGQVFQSTLLMRGATWWPTKRAGHLVISIHAPHARSDLRDVIDKQNDYIKFQSTLLMRGATTLEELAEKTGLFQSTLLMRGATGDGGHAGLNEHNFNPRSSCEERRRRHPLCHRVRTHFNPRSSCEERHPRIRQSRMYHCISIHAPHARSDMVRYRTTRRSRIFQSTLLMRGATGMA